MPLRWIAVLIALAPAACRSPGDPGASVEGCSRDLECKGDRVCVEGRCVEPSTVPAPAPGSAAPDPAGQQVPSLPFQPFPLVDAGDPLDLELPRLGPREPCLAVVEVVDYACPHTRALQPGLEGILKAHPEVAVYVLHNPLPEHPAASVLAAAASAAQLQGRFKEMHRALLAEEEVPDRDRLVSLARRLDLDVPRFLEDLRRPGMRDHVARNRIVAAALGIPGTPVLYVGGVPVQGVPAAGSLEGLVEERLARARGLRQGGLDLRQVHDTLAADYRPYQIVAVRGIRFDAVLEAERAPDSLRWYVPLEGNDAARGSSEASVTLVSYLDFGCPRSREAWAQITALEESRPGMLRLVIRAMPHEPGPGSLGAALRFDAARAQGRGMAEAERLLATGAEAQPGADAPSLEEGLRLLAGYRVRAEELAATETPTVFVNGLRRVGPLEAGALDALVDGEAALARSMVAKDLPRDQVYARLIAGGRLNDALDPEVSPFDLRKSPMLGTSGQGVDIVVFWDYSSPFCRELGGHLDRVLAAGPGQVQVYLMLLPRQEQEQSRRVAWAALCAEAQGRFPSFHAALQEGPQEVNDHAVQAAAAAAGLDLAALRACLEDPATGADLDGLVAQATTHGVTGTPVVFISGRRYRPPGGLDAEGLLQTLQRQRSSLVQTQRNF